MKFLIIAAICALTATLSSLKISHQPSNTNQSHQDSKHNASPRSLDQKNKLFKSQPAKIQPKTTQSGREDYFDWKNWRNPCPNKDNKSCWKQWFNTQLKCKVDDKQCWGNSLKKLPCQLIAKKCWTDHINTFPCKEGNSSCWSQVLPSTLPCKLDDWPCWGKLRSTEKRGVKKHEAFQYDDQDSDSYGLSSLFDEEDHKHMKKDDKGQNSLNGKDNQNIKQKGKGKQNKEINEKTDKTLENKSADKTSDKSAGKTSDKKIQNNQNKNTQVPAGSPNTESTTKADK